MESTSSTTTMKMQSKGRDVNHTNQKAAEKPGHAKKPSGQKSKSSTATGGSRQGNAGHQDSDDGSFGNR